MAPASPSRTRAFLQFGGLSGLGWLLDCTLLLLLTQAAGLPAHAANAISSCVAAGSVFTLSRLHVFNSQPQGATSRTLLYLAYTGVVIALASLAMPLMQGLLRHWAAGFGVLPSPGGVTFLAKACITPPQLLCNFLVARYFSERFGAQGAARP